LLETDVGDFGIDQGLETVVITFKFVAVNISAEYFKAIKG